MGVDCPLNTGSTYARILTLPGLLCMTTSTTSAPMTRWVRFCQRCKNTGALCRSASNKLGIWLFSILGTVAAPCLPVLIELLRNGFVQSGSFYITSAVMSAAFAVSAEHVLFRALYFALFVINLVFNNVTGPFSPQLDNWAGTLLFMVALLHAIERVWWHIVLDRPFPESR